MPRRQGHVREDGKGRETWHTRKRRKRVGTKIKQSNKDLRRNSKERQ